MDLTPIHHSSEEELSESYEARIRDIDNKMRRLQLFTDTLEATNEKWMKYIGSCTAGTRKTEEPKYEEIANGESGIFNLISDGKEAIITLEMYKKDSEFVLRRLKEPLTPVHEQPKLTHCGANIIPSVHLPQLSLSTYNGDLRHWREFWSSFNAAIHSQPLQDIQKLNYLLSCLRGEALQTVRGYDIPPENYEVIRRALMDKYGDSSTIIKLLYNEFQSLKRNDRDWKTTIETAERIFRQLEALGENLEHSVFETMVENKLPRWILDRVYQEREKDPNWTLRNLREFLGKLIIRSDQVLKSQLSNERSYINPVQKDSKSKHRHTDAPIETSTLATLKQQPPKPTSETEKRRGRRPYIFCKNDHWDSECKSYPTIKERLEYLKGENLCCRCTKKGHNILDCKTKLKCFYCKKSHNTALCEDFIPSVQREKRSNRSEISISKRKLKSEGTENDSSANSIITQTNNKEVLLPCKSVKVFNPKIPHHQREALVFFDVGSQLSFITEELANWLKANRTERQELKIASFGNKRPITRHSTKIRIGISTKEEAIVIETNAIDHPTNELQIIETPTTKEISDLHDLKGYRKKPDVLIGADYFFKFIQLEGIQQTKSGFSLLQSKVGPMLVGKGDITAISNIIGTTNSYPVCVANITNEKDVDRFWKLELMEINESVNTHDDEEALRQFKAGITRIRGRYQVRWPWKDTNVKLKDNYQLCVSRLKSLLQRIQQNEDLLTRYDETIKEQLRLNIIEEVQPNTDQAGIIHYLPHHEVEKPSSTTKLRIVYDASARLKGSKNLNDVLYRGPVTLPDLVGILLRFRTMRKVITADIEKAYLQVELHPEERNCTRFLWLKDVRGKVSNDNLKCFRFRRIPFGIKSSPFLLAATIDYYLENIGNEMATEEEVKKWGQDQTKNLWRARGRLENAELDDDAKYPVYLPTDHPITSLIIQNKHLELYHAGVAHTLSELRRKFWIPRGRSEVKKVLNQCWVCKKYNAKPFQLPPMPSLPESRVIRSRTFGNVGLDYLGPLTIRTNNANTKRWISLFTCFTTRAVHLEVVENLTAESFMHTLRRFIARRGYPKLVLSDNASQFQLVFKLLMERNSEILARKGIEWRNIMPKAPWQGGVYKRIIGLTKVALRKAIGRRLLREQELITFTVEIEGILNTRPLTYVHSEHHPVIRPIDFISPYVPLETIYDSDDDEYNPNKLRTRDQLVKYWNNTLKTLDAFWDIWRNEYLVSLRERTTREVRSPRLVEKRVPRVGEIVLLNEIGIPRGHWKLAKITAIKRGRDGEVRSATVITTNGKTLNRSIAMLSPLEVRDETTDERNANFEANRSLPEPEVPQKDLLNGRWE